MSKTANILCALFALVGGVLLAAGLKLAGFAPFTTWCWLWITAPIWGLWAATVLAALVLLGARSLQRLEARL